MTNQDTTQTDRSPGETFNELKDLVVGYARQETVGQFGRIGKWIGLGVGGAVALSIALVFILLAILRVLQVETTAFDGSWSWVPYGIVIVVAAGVLGIVVSAMTRDDSESKP